MYRDLCEYYDHFPPSAHVGSGATKLLQRCCGAAEPDALLELHAWLTPRLPHEWLTLTLGERGWTAHDTEHALCEKRRYEAAKRKMKRPRAKGVQTRLALRAARLSKVWRLLKFKQRPQVCTRQA